MLNSVLEEQETQFAQAFSVIREAIAQHAFPGATLAVTHHGALVASRGFGRFTYEQASPEVRADTVFDLASLSKAIATTTMAMLLYERGRLSLEEPLAWALPDFVTLGPADQREWRHAVTVQMLLAHSSGLPAYWRLYESATTRAELVRAALTTALTSAPGTRAEYSDIGFILLGEMLERKAGMPLDSFARKEVFQPLGMMGAGFSPAPELKAEIPPSEDDHRFRQRLIQGEVNDENAFVMGGVAGHAGLFAPATDMARFAECMLGGGAPIVRAKTVEKFTRRQTSPAGTSRALGWDTPSQPESSSGQYFSSTSFGHLGFTGTSLWIDPVRRLSVTLLTNRTWPDRSSQLIRKVRPRLHDAIVGALKEVPSE